MARAPSDSGWIPCVLVVDDSLMRRMWLKRHCEGVGCQVMLAEDGQGALALLGRVQDAELPDVVLADQLMPGMTGDRLIDRLRVTPRYRGIMAVLYSGQLEDGRSRRPTSQQRPSFAPEGPLTVDAVPGALEEVLAQLRGLRARGVSRRELEHLASDVPSSPSRGAACVTDPDLMSEAPEEDGQQLDQIASLLSQDPDNPDLLEWMAYRLYVRGHLDEAIEAFRDLLARGHRPARQLLYLGKSSFKKGRLEDARNAWRRLVHEYPTVAEARKAERLMARLQATAGATRTAPAPGARSGSPTEAARIPTPAPFRVPTAEELTAAAREGGLPGTTEVPFRRRETSQASKRRG